MVVVSIPLGGLLILVRWGVASMVDVRTFYGSLVTTTVVGCAFLLLLLILGYGFHIREITALLQRLSRRLQRRG